MTISLTGMMGCGKSTVGRALSRALGWPFVDLDDEIARAAGSTIPEIFAAEGEAGFRRREQAALEAVLTSGENQVLALGGGTLTTPACERMVREQTLAVYLKAGAETLLERLSGATAGRPMLAGGNGQTRITTLLAERSAAYERTARVTVPVAGLSVQETVAEILRLTGPLLPPYTSGRFPV